ncbi:MAG: hypothetical protein CMK09_05290 [Ponticaulis sp.]|nr:hypothetical protein [Ponticaulis sp.]
MKRSSTFVFPVLALALVACGSNSSTEAEVPDASQEQADAEQQDSSVLEDRIDADGFEEIGWEDLLPVGEEERIAELYRMQLQALATNPVREGSAADKALQIGTFNVVEELDGVKVKLPGYTVPFDFSPNAEISDFLLVPYYGACLHSPPPPPNQTLYITTDNPIRITELDQAVWVRGVLKADRQNTETADAAYTLVLSDIEEYTY